MIYLHWPFPLHPISSDCAGIWFACFVSRNGLQIVHGWNRVRYTGFAVETGHTKIATNRRCNVTIERHRVVLHRVGLVHLYLASHSYIHQTAFLIRHLQSSAGNVVQLKTQGGGRGCVMIVMKTPSWWGRHVCGGGRGDCRRTSSFCTPVPLHRSSVLHALQLLILWCVYPEWQIVWVNLNKRLCSPRIPLVCGSFRAAPCLVVYCLVGTECFMMIIFLNYVWGNIINLYNLCEEQTLD